MKLRCQQEDFGRAMSTVIRGTSSRTSMPILGNVLLETTGEGLRLTGTDLELGIRTEIPAQVEQGGLVTLPARLLSEIVAALPPAPVELSVEEGSAVAEIRCGRSHFEILGLPAKDFPRVPLEEASWVCELQAAVLRSLIRSTVFAASTDETRPFLTGVYVTAEEGVVRFVATDGGRLAVRTSPATVYAPFRGIVPSRAMHELVRLSTGSDEPVQIGLVDNQVVFAFERVRLTSRLVSGQFPNYQQVIPREFKLRIRVGTEPLRSALRRVAITARDSATVVRLTLEGEVLKLQSNTPEVGRAREELEVEATGEPLEVAFNARYLLDALSVLESAQVMLELTGPLSPGALRPVEGPDYVYVVAPVRVYG